MLLGGRFGGIIEGFETEGWDEVVGRDCECECECDSGGVWVFVFDWVCECDWDCSYEGGGSREFSRWAGPGPCHDDEAWPEVKASAGVASSVYFEFEGLSCGGDDDDDEGPGSLGLGWLTFRLLTFGVLTLPLRFLGW